MGLVLYERREYALAQDYFEQTLLMRKNLYPSDRFPEGHPEVAKGLNNLGGVLKARGDLARAQECFDEALAMARRLYAPDRYPYGHPALITALTSLSGVLERQGNHGRALEHLEQAAAMQQRLAEKYVFAVGEAEALTFIGSQPKVRDSLLSLASDVPDSTNRAYAHVWLSKGMIGRLAARRQHLLTEIGDPAIRKLGQAYERTRLELAADAKRLLEDAPFTPQQIARLQTLTDQKESLERRLADHVRSLESARAEERSNFRDLADRLPEGTVFVDFLRYSSREPSRDNLEPGKRTRSYVAFALYRGGSVLRIELGACAPIDDAIAAWRGSISPSGPRSTSQKPDAERRHELRRALWEPVERRLPAGTTTVYISSDGQLNEIPWSVLPGKNLGTVLLEDYVLATVPHGPWLTTMMFQNGWATSSPPAISRLLTVGDVAYDREPDPWAPIDRIAIRSRDAKFGDTRLRWSRLPATKEEADQIVSIGRHAKLHTEYLFGTQANERRVLQALGTARWAHLATHGFFAPSEVRSALQTSAADDDGASELSHERRRLTGRSPLLMSGLALAGANIERMGTSGEDGILTAEEIATVVMPDLELAVLSACDTGLGQVAGGEGVFGLQRAFHLAGAKNVVASLWKVDDRATAALMGVFYKKLWQENKAPIEALREAQLAIYRNPDLVGKLSTERGASFGKTVELIDKGRRSPDGKTAHPRLWAAWVLSGLGR
jgi:CHAT domain-containing protein/tetratricopeptide (TPR) repeat protein